MGQFVIYFRIVRVKFIHSSKLIRLSEVIEIHPYKTTMVGVEICDEGLTFIKKLKSKIAGLHVIESFPMPVKESMVLHIMNTSDMTVNLINYFNLHVCLSMYSFVHLSHFSVSPGF